jgi:vanillate O-demethylase ferredoxin subunit
MSEVSVPIRGTVALVEQRASIEVVVRRRTVEAERIVSYELAPLEGNSLPGFRAGAHIHVFLDNGLTRQYSLCNPSPNPASYIIAVLKEHNSRGGSAYIHERVEQGQPLRISAPFNHFELVPQAPALLLAGGIGITPILAMAQELFASGGIFELHYSARTPTSAAFTDHLKKAAFAHCVHLYYSTVPGAPRLDVAAVLSRALPGQHLGQHLYVCGPAAFIAHVLEQAASAGWSSERIHREFFAAPVEHHDAGNAFEVQLAQSGRVLQVPAGRTVSSVLIDAGVDLPLSCEAGVCGTCVTRVLEGVPDHRDVYLTDQEHARNDCFTPCCSRARSSRLVLDL